MAQQITGLINDRLVAAISHPTRMRAMCLLWEKEASPREIAAELDEPLNNVTYHVKQLLELGWIELVAQRPAHGGRVVEHFYKASRSSEFGDAELQEMGTTEKLLLDTAILDAMSKELSEALLSGSFTARPDNEMVRVPLDLDEEGWKETKEILNRALTEILKVKETVLQRTADTGEETFPTKVAIMHFMSPRPKGSGENA
jgi:DNA-binding transcriptional ArsR family regulator